MQKLAEICVRRPVFATMLIVAFTVIGGFSFFTLGVDRFPKIDLADVTVATINPGAAPEEIETEITDLIEGALNTVSGYRGNASTSVEGLSQCYVTFDLDKDLDVAARKSATKSHRHQPTSDDGRPADRSEARPRFQPILMYTISATRAT